MYTQEEIWLGGFYEVSIELGERSDTRLRTALNTLWESTQLEGCFPSRDVEPEEQEKRPAESFGIDSGVHCLGIATLPNGNRTACATCIVREPDGPDWINLYLPMGALGTAYPVGAFPFVMKSDPYPEWLHEVEAWLADHAVRLEDRIEYQMALIGFEVSGTRYAADLQRDGIPETRYIGYIWPEDGQVKYYPSTEDLRQNPQ